MKNTKIVKVADNAVTIRKPNLTWQDVKLILKIADEIFNVDVFDREVLATEESYYKEVLRKFNEE